MVEIQGKSLARNVVWNLLGQTVPLTIGIVSIPLAMRGLGNERFGLLTLAWAVLGYFGLFDLGLGQATTKFISSYLRKNEIERVPELIWTAFGFQLFLGTLAGLCCAFATPWLVESLLKIPAPLVGEATVVFRLMALSLPVNFVSGVFSGSLGAAQRFDIINAYRIPSSALTYIFPALAFWVDLRLSHIVLLLLLIKVFLAVMFFKENLKIYPRLKRLLTPNPALFRRIFSFGGWMTLTSITAPIFDYLERFLITSYIAVGQLPYYSAPYDLVARIAIFPASMLLTLFPAFSYFGRDDKEASRQILVRPLKYLLMILTPVLVGFLLFSQDLLRIWLGRDYALRSYDLIRILAVSFFLNAFAHIPLALIQGLGRPDLKAKLALLELPLFVLLCFWLIPSRGLVGAAWAKLAVTVVDVCALFILGMNTAGFQGKDLLALGMKRTLALSGVFFVLCLGIGTIPLPRLFLFLFFGAALGFFWAFSFRLCCDARDRSVVLEIGRMIPFLKARRLTESS